MNRKENNFIWFLILWILFGNLIVQYTGAIHYVFDPGIYWLPEYALKTNFIFNIYHLHTNPPLINLIAGIVYNLHIPLYIFCTISFAFMQVISTILFYKLLLKNKIPYAALFTMLTFGNPLHFIWFSFYYYPAIIFFISILSLHVLYSSNSPLIKFNKLALLFTILCLLRASYHPIWVFILLCSFRKNLSLRKMVPGFLLLLIPLFWYTKNYSQYGFWGSSSLFGQNISAHYPDNLRKKINNFNSHGRFKRPYEYEALHDLQSPLIERYKFDRLLNDSTTLHNIRTIPLSDAYKKETIANLDLKYSLLTIAYGTFSYFGSPAIDEYNNKSEKPFFWNNTFLIDWFDLPNIKKPSSNGGYSFIRLSWYTFIYPLTILVLLFNYRSLSFEIKFILKWILITGIIYCTIDPNEAARMRYELEPLFYFLIASLLIGGQRSKVISQKL